MQQVKAGKLKALAATSQDRSDIFPDVPTFVEQGFADTVANQWAGTLAPAGTAPAVIVKLSAAFNAALTDADVRRRLAQAGVTPSPSTPDEFARYLEQEIARWRKLIREKGIKGEYPSASSVPHHAPFASAWIAAQRRQASAYGRIAPRLHAIELRVDAAHLFHHPAQDDTGADRAECEPDQRRDGEGRHERASREIPYSPYRAHNARASIAEIISSPKPVARGK